MPRIIDGDNLLGTWPGRKRSDSDRRELARCIGRWSHRERRRVILVFDGPDPPVPPPVHDVHFSGPGTSADDWIIDFLRRLPTAGGWILVTNDRSLGDQCRHLGARVERCDQFRRRLAPTKGGEKPEGPVDVDEWLEIFGTSPDEST